MHAPRSLLAIATTLVLLIPAAHASWKVGGTYEPDTSYDASGFMWQEEPGSIGNRIYFNAWAMSAPLGVAGASPNVGALETRIEVPAHEYQFAVFGIWKDCNLDGYIGAAEHGLREYSAALLLEPGPCAAQNGDPLVWPAGAHNYNGWVSEYVPIANDPDEDDRKFDLRVYHDPEAMVWGDYHRPDEKPYHRSCALAPQPRGFYQSTGGTLNYVDCRADILGLANVAFDAAGDPLGLRFDDENDARTSPLGEIQTAGSDDSENAAVYVADCEADPIVRVGDVINGTTDDENIRDQTEIVHDVRVMPADPRTGDTSSPTAPGQTNQTVEELWEDCDTSNDEGHDFYGNDKLGTGLPFYVGEEDFNGVDPNNKHESDWNFGFATLSRGPPVNTNDPLSEDPSDATGIPGTDAGVGWLGLSGSGWYGPSVWATKPGPSLVRENVDPADPIAPAYWLSYYAHAGAMTYARGFQSPGATGVYGSWHCGSNDSGIHNGWNCDVDTWYKNMDGSHYEETYPFARPGQQYEFRDVDCYDGSLGDTGVGILPAFYGSDPCE